MRTLTTLAGLALSLLTACGHGDDTSGEVDAGAFAPPSYREEECIALCGQHQPDPGPDLCTGATDRGACEVACEAADGSPAATYCPTGGNAWRPAECAYLCDHGGTCAGADPAQCRSACAIWSETGAYCPGGVR